MRSVQLCDSVYDAGRGGRGFWGDHDLHELQLGWSCHLPHGVWDFPAMLASSPHFAKGDAGLWRGETAC